MTANTSERNLPAWLVLLLATACGLIVANIYYAQPLVGPIAAELGLSPGAAGLIVTMTQIGYGVGLLLIVPLGDLFENRKLSVTVVVLAALSLLAAGLADRPATFMVAALCIGLASVAVQILVPYAAHLALPARRGQVVGNVMSGLMLGIMLARPVASFITQVSSWHVVFYMSTAVMAVVALVLSRAMPIRKPPADHGYGELLLSMGRLALTTPILRRRALYQACMFGAFSLFWTASPLLLAQRYGFSQAQIALFALAGVAGAISAPIAGRLADAGLSRPATLAAMLLGVASFLITLLAEPGSAMAVTLLVVAAVVLDFGVSANVVLGQRAIYSLGDTYRGRLNGLYMATFFGGGAIGSGIGGWTFAHGGWPLTAWVGLALPVLGLLYFATELGGVPEPRWMTEPEGEQVSTKGV